MLRAVFVSDTAISRGHVYGLRILSFARELAARGHRIVLFGPAERNDDASPTDGVGARLQSHDWRNPLFVAAKRRPKAIQLGGWPTPLRKGATFASFLRHGGTDQAWQSAAVPLIHAIAQGFAPDVVWATFGTSSNLRVAQDLARSASCPWVADFKDNVDIYIPPGTRSLLARRFADVGGLTSNARLHAAAVATWLKRESAVVYSGIADGMIATADSRPSADVFLITLIGSVYNAENTRAFVRGVAAWLSRFDTQTRARVGIRYAGVAPDVVRDTLAAHPLGIPLEISGNLPHTELAALCHSAAVNCYIWHSGGFHHKALELLACRRPIITFPGEHPETLDLAAQVGGCLTPCGDADALAGALDAAFARWRSRGPMPAFDAGPFSWEAQGEVLETVLRTAVEGARR